MQPKMQIRETQEIGGSDKERIIMSFLEEKYKGLTRPSKTPVEVADLRVRVDESGPSAVPHTHTSPDTDVSDMEDQLHRIFDVTDTGEDVDVKSETETFQEQFPTTVFEVPSEDDDEEEITDEGIVGKALKEREAEQAREAMPVDSDVGVTPGTTGFTGLRSDDQVVPDAEQRKKEAEAEKVEKDQNVISSDQLNAEMDSFMKSDPLLTVKQAQERQEARIREYRRQGKKVETEGLKNRAYGADFRDSMSTFVSYVGAAGDGVVSAVEGAGMLAAYAPRLPGILHTMQRREGETVPFQRLNSPLFMNDFYALMGKNTISDMYDALENVTDPSQRAEMLDDIARLEAIEGPNMFAEIFTKLFHDSTTKMHFIDDVSNFGKVFYPQVVGDAMAEGIHNAFTPIHNALQIDPSQRDGFHEALTFGGTMFFVTPLAAGSNIFRLGAVKASRAGAKMGMPYMKEGSRIHNFTKSYVDKLQGQAGPWGDPFGIKVRRDIVMSDARMAVGGAAWYAGGDYLFSDSDSPNMKYLFGVVGSLSALADGSTAPYKDPVMVTARNSWKGLTGLAYIMTAAAHKTAAVTAGKRISDAEMYGMTNLFLMARGYSSAQIKEMEQESIKAYNAIITKEGKDAALEAGAAIPDGFGGVKVNLDFGKMKYVQTSAKELEFYRRTLAEMNAMDVTDPSLAPFKRDILNSGLEAQRLFEGLAAGIQGADKLEKMNAIGTTITDLLQLNSIRNYQAVQLSKLNLGWFGTFKKGEIVSMLERTDRQLDIRLQALQNSIKDLKLTPDADDNVKRLFANIRENIMDTTKARTRNKIGVTRLLTRLEDKMMKKGIAKTEKDALKNEEILQRGRFGVLKELDEHAFQVEQFIFGRKGLEIEKMPFRGKTAIPQTTSTVNGMYTRINTTSSDNYKAAFNAAKADDGSPLFYLDGNGLMNMPESVFNSLTANASMAIRDEAKREIYKGLDSKFTSTPLLNGFRERGLNLKKQELSEDDYADYLDEIYRDNRNTLNVDMSKPNINRAEEIENAILNHSGPLKYKDGLLPAPVTLEEWHFLRSRLLSMQRKTTDGIEEAGISQSIDRFETIYKRKLDEGTIPKDVHEKLEIARKYYKDRVVPWQQVAWHKDVPTDKSSPYSYLDMFLREANAKNANIFRQLFTEDNGEINKTAVDLLHKTLGKLLDQEQGGLKLKNIKFHYEDIFAKGFGGGVAGQRKASKMFAALDQAEDFKRLMMHGSTQLPEESVKKIEDVSNSLKEWFKQTDEMAAQALTNSFYGSLAGRLDRATLPLDSPEMIKAFERGDSFVRRSTIVDTLLSSSTPQGKAFVASPSISRQVADERQRTLEEQLSRLRQAGATSKQIEEARKKAEDALPPVVDDEYERLQTPLTLFLNHLDEQVKAGKLTEAGKEKLVDNVKDLITEEMFDRNFKYTRQLRITGTAERVAALPKKGTGYLAKPVTITKEVTDTEDMPTTLRMEINVVGLKKAFDDNKEALRQLYGTSDKGKKQFENIEDMIATSLRLEGEVGRSMSVAGQVSDYTFAMGMGRMYNTMKGVLSIRYAIMEGGAVKARRQNAAMMMKMFTDPAAVKVAHKIFYEGSATIKDVKLFKKFIERNVGYELSSDEDKQLMIGILNSERFLVNQLVNIGRQENRRKDVQYLDTKLNIRKALNAISSDDRRVKAGEDTRIRSLVATDEEMDAFRKSTVK